MSFLSKVQTGKIQRPYYMLAHGIPGIGKSKFAEGAPNPIYLCPEKGTDHLDVARLELPEFEDYIATLEELRTADHKFKTVVIDTVDHLEPLIFKRVCAENKKDSIEDIGYAKGYIYALDYWNRLIDALEKLRDEKGMNVILLAHTEVKTFNDPQLPMGYDRYQIKLHHKAASLLVDRVEAVLFFNFETFVKKDDNSGKTKAFGDGVRVIFTEHRPAFIAKNRYDLPFKLPLDFESFDQAARLGRSKDPADIKKNIEELLTLVKDETVRTKATNKLKEAGDNAKILIALENKLKAIVAA